VAKRSIWIALLIVAVLGFILVIAVSKLSDRGDAAYLAVGLPVLGLVVAMAIGFRYISRDHR
jgi:hypothetical protein